MIIANAFNLNKKC